MVDLPSDKSSSLSKRNSNGKKRKRSDTGKIEALHNTSTIKVKSTPSSLSSSERSYRHGLSSVLLTGTNHNIDTYHRSTPSKLNVAIKNRPESGLLAIFATDDNSQPSSDLSRYQERKKSSRSVHTKSQSQSKQNGGKRKSSVQLLDTNTRSFRKTPISTATTTSTLRQNLKNTLAYQSTKRVLNLLDNDDDVLALSSSQTTMEANDSSDVNSTIQVAARHGIKTKCATHLKNMNGVSSSSKYACKESSPMTRSKPGNSNYQQQFLDDGSGRRPVHAHTLHSAMRVVKSSAGRMVRMCRVTDVKKCIRLERHVESITQQVRQRLRTSKLPTVYTRADESCLDSMAEINSQRQVDIEMSKRVLEQLRVKRQQLEKELRNEMNQKEQYQQQHTSMKQYQRERVHPLLLDYTKDTMTQDLVVVESNTVETIKFRNFSPAPAGTMAKLCAAMLKQDEDDEDEEKDQNKIRK